MSKSKIEWTDETANWIVGCTKTRAKGAKKSGCDNCYAATSANSARLQQFPQYKNVVDHKGNWNGNVEFVPKVLDALLKGKKERRVFAPSMSDPFHPNVKTEWLDQFFAVVAFTPHITYQVLTKRPERMYEYFSDSDTCGRIIRQQCQLILARETNLFVLNNFPLPNLHLGISVENQKAFEERSRLLLLTPAAKRFLSVEPLLEEIDISEAITTVFCTRCNWSGDYGEYNEDRELEECPRCHQDSLMDRQWTTGENKIDQVIAGGESGLGARPFHLEWARSIHAQCREAGVAFFLKQVGGNPFLGGDPLKLKNRKGSDMEEWPEDLRVREAI